MQPELQSAGKKKNSHLYFASMILYDRVKEFYNQVVEKKQARFRHGGKKNALRLCKLRK